MRRNHIRSKQFKSFVALLGYEELVVQVMAEADKSHEVFSAEEPCRRAFSECGSWVSCDNEGGATVLE